MHAFTKIVFTLFVFFLAMPAVAQESIFTVKGVEVDVTADSAAQARERAFSQAQAIAFETLTQRMVSSELPEDFEKPDADFIASLIQDFEITEERLSAVRYIGTYTFRFKDRPVRNYFSQIGASYTDVSSRPVLILPFYQVGEETVLWSPYNIWMRTWRSSGDQSGIVPMIVPLGDVEDIQDIGNHEALSYDQVKLARITNRYRAGEAVLVIAVPDVTLANVVGMDDTAFGILSVYIYRTDRKGPEFVERLAITPRSGQTKEELYTDAVGRVQRALKANWKDRTTVNPEEANNLMVRAHFNSFQEWTRLQAALEDVYGIDMVNIKALSSENATLELVFDGSERRLRLALAQAELTLTTPRIDTQSFVAVRSDGQLPLVYDLYLGR